MKFYILNEKNEKLIFRKREKLKEYLTGRNSFRTGRNSFRTGRNSFRTGRNSFRTLTKKEKEKEKEEIEEISIKLLEKKDFKESSSENSQVGTFGSVQVETFGSVQVGTFGSVLGQSSVLEVKILKFKLKRIKKYGTLEDSEAQRASSESSSKSSSESSSEAQRALWIPAKARLKEPLGIVYLLIIEGLEENTRYAKILYFSNGLLEESSLEALFREASNKESFHSPANGDYESYLSEEELCIDLLFNK